MPEHLIWVIKRTSSKFLTPLKRKEYDHSKIFTPLFCYLVKNAVLMNIGKTPLKKGGNRKILILSLKVRNINTPGPRLSPRGPQRKFIISIAKRVNRLGLRIKGII